ncbi:hypothetical protein GPECTOR_33g637 [Gonium pectorale]|uniref:Nucleoside phosphorylase domain-containing protein n=1 Tax=Gonium pectorale TaxID=33097 RepID=A0A150GDT6_GONPE|nr:hypothetical protein GPECTOR_33g637 [Gonium pectorale]|eukprot:KXZ47755.1 hypothetical protein GPECTOR_33g637 [Gonium pectorale]
MLTAPARTSARPAGANADLAKRNAPVLMPACKAPSDPRSSTVVRAQGTPELPIAVIGRHKPTYKNANFPTDAEGRTYHLGTKEGEVAPRILSVGSVGRAQLLSTLLDPPAAGKTLFHRTSSRGFLTITGRYEGEPVSIVSTHMGMPNMDFVVRENRAVVRGQMAIIRLGTCGAVQRPAKLGDLLIASHGSIGIRRDPDYWTLLDSESSLEHTNGHKQSNGSGGNGSANGHANGHSGAAAAGGRKPYAVALPVPADPQLAALLSEEAARVVGAARVVQGLNASADSFYSSQGRTGTDFDDRNEGLLGELVAEHPDLVSLEMETFQLLDLARCSRGSIKAIGMCVALAERYSNAFLEYSKLEELEIAGGTAALRTLVRVPLDRQAPAVATADIAEERAVQYVWD